MSFFILTLFGNQGGPTDEADTVTQSPFSTLAISTILFESVSNPNGIHFCALRRMYIPR